jgi:hypothetical protein
LEEGGLLVVSSHPLDACALTLVSHGSLNPDIGKFEDTLAALIHLLCYHKPNALEFGR